MILGQNNKVLWATCSTTCKKKRPKGVVKQCIWPILLLVKHKICGPSVVWSHRLVVPLATKNLSYQLLPKLYQKTG